jgi:hypothetical protein
VAANEQFAKMWKLMDSMPAEEQTAAFDFGDDFEKKESHWQRDKNLRDVFVHLYEWHQLLIKWLNANQNGTPQPFLPEPYNWKTYPAMNVGFWKKHQDTPYEKSIALLKASHADVLARIESFTEEELFEKKHFSWTGTNNLGSYCISTTSSHYDWAIKKIKLHMKTYRADGAK